MLDIGWWELAVVAMIALIVVGPKDLPRIMRVVGRWAGKARAMAREFQSSVDDDHSRLLRRSSTTLADPHGSA